MADSGIERTVTLPEIPHYFDPVMIEYLKNLQEAIAAAYDALASRINEFLWFSEWQSVTPDLVTSDQNNYLLPDNGIVIKISTDAARTFHGFVAPLVSRFVVIFNNGSFNIALPHQSGSADLANRLSTSTGNTVTLAPDQSASFWYDVPPDGISRWRQLIL